MQYLWNTQEAKVLRQQGQVGKANAALDWLVNGTVAKVHFSPVKLKVWRGHNCLDCEMDRLHLNAQTLSIFTDLALLSLSGPFSSTSMKKKSFLQRYFLYSPLISHHCIWSQFYLFSSWYHNTMSIKKSVWFDLCNTNSSSGCSENCSALLSLFKS